MDWQVTGPPRSGTPTAAGTGTLTGPAPRRVPSTGAEPLGHDEINALRSTGSGRRSATPILLTVALLVLTATAGFVAGASAGGYRLIREARHVLEATGSDEFDVQLTGSGLTLSGIAADDQERTQVLEALAALPGVGYVDDQTRLPDDLPANGETLTARLVSAGFEDLTVSVSGSTATVSGVVATVAEIDAVAAIVLDTAGIDQFDDRLLTDDSGILEAEVEAAAILSAAGYDNVSVRVSEGTAVLTGFVASSPDRVHSASLLLEAGLASKIDNRIVVDPNYSPIRDADPTPEEVQAATTDILAASGFSDVTITVEGHTGYLDGTVPIDALADGYFAYTNRLRTLLSGVAGLDAVVNRLHIRADDAVLLAQLEDLTSDSPIVFSPGSVRLNTAGRQVLDEVATLILSRPGPHVSIAAQPDGRSSSDGEQLARTRTAAVLSYLVDQGVPDARLSLSSPITQPAPAEVGADGGDGRIIFVVGP